MFGLGLWMCSTWEWWVCSSLGVVGVQVETVGV